MRSTIVDGQWIRRKYRAARTLSALCAHCGSEEGSLMHRHFRCSEVQDVAPCNTPEGSCGSTSLSPRALAHRTAASWCTAPFEIRWQADRSLVTGVFHGDGSVSEGQPVSASETLPFLRTAVSWRKARANVTATEASTSAWADLWRDVWREIDAWRGRRDDLSVR